MKVSHHYLNKEGWQVEALDGLMWVEQEYYQQALNHGFDVPDADMGIICGVTSKSLSMIQRVGRLIRFQEDKIGRIVILYVKDSQEEKWVKSSVKSLDNVNWLSSINDFN